MTDGVLLVDPGAVSEYAEAGADRMLLGVPATGRDKVLPVLDGFAGMIDQFG